MKFFKPVKKLFSFGNKSVHRQWKHIKFICVNFFVITYTEISCGQGTFCRLIIIEVLGYCKIVVTNLTFIDNDLVKVFFLKLLRHVTR